MASPLWGKLSPQVTDEGASAGRLPLIRRIRATFPQGGRLLSSPLMSLFCAAKTYIKNKRFRAQTGRNG